MFNKTLVILALFNTLLLTNHRALSNPLPEQEEETIHEQWEANLNKWAPKEEQEQVAISPYDNLFRTVCEQQGNDWRLLCAMAYHESRFKPEVVSNCGARGILQVMPHVAKQFDVSADQLSNVEDNIYVANRVVSLIEQMLRLPKATPMEDRLKLTLAAYNCGIGRVADARRLARSFGEDSTSWEVVSQYLTRMNSPEYYNQTAVKYGRFKGAGQTLAYVKNVVNHYNNYCLVAAR